MNTKYSAEQKAEVVRLLKLGVPNREIEQRTGVPYSTIAQIKFLAKNAQPLMPASNYPVYDKPLEMDGDALILPDLEIPFHHAEFINQVLDLAQVWGIEQCILAGDAVHFDCFSGWEPNWTNPLQGGISVSAEEKLKSVAMDLPAKYQDRVMEAIVDIGGIDEAPGITSEMKAIRKTIKVLADIFKLIQVILGNHEGRMLRTINGPMIPGEIFKWLELDQPCWEIAPYYYSILHTPKDDFRISHPKSASKNAHIKGADKYDCNFAMCHSHKWAFNTSTNGKHWAIQMGCCVDERRLPYASQRDNSADVHKLGALIIRNGYPYLLSEETDWEAMKRMK